MFANAQTVFLTSQNYENLKAAGKLHSKTIYKFIDEPNYKVQQPKQNIAVNSSSNLLSAKVNSVGSCQCLVPLDPTSSKMAS